MSVPVIERSADGRLKLPGFLWQLTQGMVFRGTMELCQDPCAHADQREEVACLRRCRDLFNQSVEETLPCVKAHWNQSMAAIDRERKFGRPNVVPPHLSAFYEPLRRPKFKAEEDELDPDEIDLRNSVIWEDKEINVREELRKLVSRRIANPKQRDRFLHISYDWRRWWQSKDITGWFLYDDERYIEREDPNDPGYPHEESNDEIANIEPTIQYPSVDHIWQTM